MPYFWALYVLLAFVPYASHQGTTRGLLITAAGVAVVLALYLRAFSQQGIRLVCHSVGITLVGMLVAKPNAWASVFFVYAACCGAGLPRLRDGFALLGFNLAMIGLTAVFWERGPNFWAFGAFFTVAACVPSLYTAQMTRVQMRLLRKQEEVEFMATLAERGRIARDMHDVLGHSMSIIVLKSQLLARLLEDTSSDRARSELADVESTAREALQQLRQCVDGYRAAGLPHELRTAERTLTAAGVQLIVEGELPSPPAAMENLLALSLREAITNVLRHSRARWCRVQLWSDSDGVRCEVRDDGVGIGAARRGNGLLGLRERLEAAGGRLHLSDLSPGTLVRFDLPALPS